MANSALNAYVKGQSGGGSPNPYLNAYAKTYVAPAPVVAPAPRPSLFSRLANRLATSVGVETKNQGAADRSLASGQDQLLRIIKDPKISPNRKIGAYRSAMSNYDPVAAAANTKATAQAYSGKALLKGLGSGLIAAPKYVAGGVARVPALQGVLRTATGTKNNAAGQEAADRSLESARVAITQALHSSHTSPAGKNRLISVLNGLYDTKAAAANTKEVEDATNKRRFLASAYETGLQPALFGSLAGTEGLASAGVTAAQGVTGGVLGAAAAPKFSSKEALKQAIIQGGIPLVAHGLGYASKEVSAALGHDQATADLIRNSKVNDLLQAGAAVPKKQPKLLGAGELRTAREKGGTFGTQSSTKLAVAKTLNKIDSRLAAIEKGTVKATPEERVALFKQRQAITSGDLSSVKAAAVSNTPVAELDQAISKAPISSKQADKIFENATIAPKRTVLGVAKGIFNPVAKFGAKGKQALSEFQTELGQITEDLKPAIKGSAERQAALDKLSQKDQLKFIYNVQHDLPQPTKELQSIADQYKALNAKGLEFAKKINPNVHEVTNYFTQSGLMSKQNASDLAQKWLDKSNLPGSVKSRTFPTVEEAIKFANENNIPLRETNPEKLFLNNHQAVITSANLRGFANEQLAKGTDPQIVQSIIDRYSETGISGNPLFQRYRQVAGTANNVQLVGAFHFAKSTFEKINNDVSAVAREVTAGHPLLATKDAGKFILQDAKGLGYLKGRGLREDMANGVVNKYTDAAKLANFNTSTDTRFAVKGFKTAYQKTWDDLTSKQLGKTVRGATLGLPRQVLGTINTVMKPLMNRFVPNLKNAAFMNQVDAADHILGSNATKEAKALAYQKAGNTVDGIMGQMNQDNLFWSKTAKDILSIFMRSPSYNIGTVQQVGGGLKDLLSPSTYKALAKGEGLSTRASYTVAMTANTMLLGATATYLFTGKGPTQLIDYFYPPTGKTDAKGNKERLSLPSYAKDVFAFHNNPGQTISNKMGPVISTGLQVASNKNYYGDQVRNPQDSLLTQAKQAGGYVTKNALPFSVTNANKRVDKGLGAKAESFFGFGVAPGYITKSPFQQKVESALNTALGSKPLTPEEQKLVTEKGLAKQALQSGDSSKIDALLNSGQITQRQADNLKTAAQQTSLASSFQYLLKVDRPAAAKLIEKAGPDDTKKLGDLSKLIKSLQYNTGNKNSLKTTRDASSKLLQVLNSKR